MIGYYFRDHSTWFNPEYDNLYGNLYYSNSISWDGRGLVLLNGSWWNAPKPRRELCRGVSKGCAGESMEFSRQNIQHSRHGFAKARNHDCCIYRFLRLLRLLLFGRAIWLGHWMYSTFQNIGWANISRVYSNHQQQPTAGETNTLWLWLT